jgi:hypothetical protein
MTFQANVADMLMLGSGTLRDIAHKRLPEGIKTRIVEQGAGEEMLFVMSARKDTLTQLYGMGFLFSMMLTPSRSGTSVVVHPSNMKALGFQAISATLGAMRTTNQDVKFLGNSCVLLSYILRDPCGALAKSFSENKHTTHASEHAELLKTCQKYQDEFARCGGIMVLVDFLKLHLKSVSPQSDMESIGFAGHACNVIGVVLYLHAKNQSSFNRHDALSLLLRVRRIYKSNEFVQDMAQVAVEQLQDEESHLTGMNEDESNAKRDGDTRQPGCVACGKTAVTLGTKLLRCSACTLAPSYCSVGCQKACWKEHKAECKANRKPA